MRTVEHVAVTVTITHPCRGTLEIVLVCPSGMTSVIGARRVIDRYTNTRARESVVVVVIHSCTQINGEQSVDLFVSSLKRTDRLSGLDVFHRALLGREGGRPLHPEDIGPQ